MVLVPVLWAAAAVMEVEGEVGVEVEAVAAEIVEEDVVVRWPAIRSPFPWLVA